MISSHSIQHLPSKSFMTARLTKCSIQWYASPLQFVRYRGWVWERVESNAGQFTSFRFSPRPSLLSSDHGWVCRVLIKIVTRLRGEVTRLSLCPIWQQGHFAMKNKGGTLPCCHVPSPSSWAMADCHHPPNNESSSYLSSNSKNQLFVQIQCFPAFIVWWQWIIVLVLWFDSNLFLWWLVIKGVEWQTYRALSHSPPAPALCSLFVSSWGWAASCSDEDNAPACDNVRLPEAEGGPLFN